MQYLYKFPPDYKTNESIFQHGQYYLVYDIYPFTFRILFLCRQCCALAFLGLNPDSKGISPWRPGLAMYFLLGWPEGSKCCPKYFVYAKRCEFLSLALTLVQRPRVETDTKKVVGHIA